MDNKIKIIISLLIGLFCFVSCAFDGNIEFYERKINDWAKVAYWFQDKSDTATFVGFELYATQEKMDIDKRLVWNGSYDNRKENLSSMPNQVIYNNDFIIADDGYENTESCKYYRIVPSYNEFTEKEKTVIIDRITKEKFDSIKANCTDCRVISKTKLQNIQYEEEEKEKNSFQTKIVIFFSLIFLYVFYRIYKREKKKKARRK